MRVGIGYDAHQLVNDRKLILGGIEVPHAKGLLGHSDADVLIHAIIDALFGAAGLGTIGDHFPDSDKQYKDIASSILLKKTAELIKHRGFEVMNIDSVIIAEKPKLQTYLKKMSTHMAHVLEIPASHINVKAKTTEGLGFAGRKEGIAAEAVCLLHSYKTD